MVGLLFIFVVAGKVPWWGFRCVRLLFFPLLSQCVSPYLPLWLLSLVSDCVHPSVLV